MCFVTAITLTQALQIGTLASGAAGAVMSYSAAQQQAAGAKVTAQATANARNYAAQVAENNATTAGRNAEATMKAGKAKAEAASMKNAATVARVGAAMAANGVDINDGSAVDVKASQRMTGVLDAETVLNNAALESYGYRVSQSNYEAQAEMDRTSAGYALVGGDVAADGIEAGASGGLLSSASSLGFKWSAMGPGATSTPASGAGINYAPDDL